MKKISEFINIYMEHINNDEDLIEGGPQNYPEQKMSLEELSSIQNKTYKYFGNCINTVDIDRMWDASQMQGFINSCKLVPIDVVISKLMNGDRNIPKKLLKHITSSKQELICGMDNWKQQIMFIYDSIDDIHYFFDIN